MEKPTDEQVGANAVVEIDGQLCLAAWYPQMGGYVGRCWVALNTCGGLDGPSEDDGFDVYVWHDGDFPFGDGWEPYVLHHCSPDQFIEFGELVGRAQRERCERA